jgi:HPt (histidine-containing phosphotransfer) domain-containing protein
MLVAFLSSHAQEASQLKVALAAGDVVTLKEVAHSLKGSGGNIGAVRLAQMAEALDLALRDAAPQREIDDLSAALIAELSQLIAGLHEATQLTKSHEKLQQ